MTHVLALSRTQAPRVCSSAGMVRLGLWFALTLTCGVASGATDVRVATYNLRNYLCMDRRIDGRFQPGHPKPEQEKAAVRDVLRAVDAEVVCLQEIGPRPFLDELQQDLAREGLAYEHAAWLDGPDQMRHVAVLSRIPFRAVVPHADVIFKHLKREERVRRGMLEVHFDSPAGMWRLFVVHLKSPLTEEAADPRAVKRRTSEARALRDLILARTGEGGANFLIAGDFNDATDSRTLGAFRARGRRVLARIVPAADSRGETWTHRQASSDRYDRVDYILASPSLLPRVVGGGARIFDEPNAMDGSDHRLIYLDLALDEVPVTTHVNAKTPAGARPAGVSEKRNGTRSATGN